MRKINYFLILLALTILPLARPVTVQKVELHDVLSTDLSLKENVSILLAENELSSFAMALPARAQNLLVDGKPHISSNNTFALPLNCTTCLIQFSYTIPGAIKSEGNDYYTFSRTLFLPKQPQQIVYRVYIPPGYSIGSKSADDFATVPKPSEMETDGKRIYITWTEDNPQLPKIYSVKYHWLTEQEKFVGQIIEELREPAVWIILIASVLAGFAIGAAIFHLYCRTKRQAIPYIPRSMLTPDEKTVISLLKKGSDINQKEITRQLGWSKSKVSAIMTNLDSKEVVKREKFGRNYKITLIKEFEP